MQRPEYMSTGKLLPSGHLHPGAREQVYLAALCLLHCVK